MRIERFARAHVEPASEIALRRYRNLRDQVPALPDVERWPDLTDLADTDLGVAAFEGNQLVGYLCSVPIFENAFGSTSARGAFSPMHGNAAIGENRAEVYARMIELAADLWANAGAASHAVCLHAPDHEAQRMFFLYGYGMRCMDAIRPMQEIETPSDPSISCEEVAPRDLGELFPLMRALDAHMGRSPTFIRREMPSDEERMRDILECGARIFAARRAGEVVAFVMAQARWAETFVSAMPGMWNLAGAYCLPAHRGSGAIVSAMNAAIRALKADGAQRLGVDFESINPAAYRFWTKHFMPYTSSVVRRIDERGVTGV